MVSNGYVQKGRKPMDPIHALCATAVASIADDVREGLIGTHHVGLHLVIMLADENRVVYEEGFGSKYSRSDCSYRHIATQKANLAFEHRCSFNELGAEVLKDIRNHDYHNGFFFRDGIIVAVAGAGHLGNVSFGRRVLNELLQNPLMLRAPETAAAA